MKLASWGGPWGWRWVWGYRKDRGPWKDRRDYIPDEKHSRKKVLEAEATWQVETLATWFEVQRVSPEADCQAHFLAQPVVPG